MWELSLASTHTVMFLMALTKYRIDQRISDPSRQNKNNLFCPGLKKSEETALRYFVFLLTLPRILTTRVEVLNVGKIGWDANVEAAAVRHCKQIKLLESATNLWIVELWSLYLPTCDMLVKRLKLLSKQNIYDNMTM